MASTLTGIMSPTRKNPVLASWMHSNALYLFGLSVFFISPLATLLFAFPLKWREVALTVDFVMCCGCCTKVFGQTRSSANQTQSCRINLKCPCLSVTMPRA